MIGKIIGIAILVAIGLLLFYAMVTSGLGWDGALVIMLSVTLASLLWLAVWLIWGR